MAQLFRAAAETRSIWSILRSSSCVHTLLIAGGNDHPVIGMNEKAFERLKIKDKRLDLVPELRIFARSLANLRRGCAPCP
ncbi:MAG TPA: hypothetical protein VFH09_03040 [Nitrososphaera sp.]|nr:hypothetical protein [Nitrososphaera sp.]